jgi:hypothetical protein
MRALVCNPTGLNRDFKTTPKPKSRTKVFDALWSRFSLLALAQDDRIFAGHRLQA